ncbi:MAG: hypothetical protein CMJ94_00945 [Planctomycetes bacterium]|nr:hypothetical protein [Planctomycetota bacterium]
MNQSQKLVSFGAALGLGLALSLPACSDKPAEPTSGGSGGSTTTATTASKGDGKPTDSGLPGLILAKSVFDDGPTPSSMVLLRPLSADDKDWTEESIVAPRESREFGLGNLADGSPVVAELDGEGEPTGEAMQFVPGPTGWSLEPASGEVEWPRNSAGKVTKKSYEMKGGNVFHKAMWWEPAFGDPGILTISANMPYLQIWRRGSAGWTSETLWTAIVGGKEQRFRDVEIGDVDGDGQDELVVVTHDAGAVFVIEQTAEGLVPTELHRWEERIFAHEVEIGDVDGDGKPEFFTTPSEPNRLDGQHQAGWIDMYRHNAESGEYTRVNVAELTDRHAKEVMAADYDGDGRVELYAALEAEGTVDKVNAVRRWVWDGEAMVEDATIEIDGKMCRFLVLCDTTGDGVNEIIAATRKAGIFRIHQEDGEWKTKKIVMSYMSGGFEHATYAFDWDGDGKDELFVASDEQKKMNMFRHNSETDSYKPTGIASWKGSDYFVWNVMPLPIGK